MASEKITIHHVSDTAVWVAYYRALESERPDSLFQDRFAKMLIGERGQEIAESMKPTSRYTQWAVVIRTWVIDHYIQSLVQEGVDMVINLGAGLDTRPYRLNLPKTLRWIEVDYLHVIEHKEKFLAGETPQVQLRRVAMDLSDRDKRQELFSELNAQSKKALILTEGVIPYLTEQQVATLAEDLQSKGNFHFWIAEYISSEIYRYYKTHKRMKQMKNAPFHFFPKNWLDFFRRYGWSPREIRYLAEESLKLKRPRPAPWWAYILLPFVRKKTMEKSRRQMGYVLFTHA